MDVDIYCQELRARILWLSTVEAKILGCSDEMVRTDDSRNQKWEDADHTTVAASDAAAGGGDNYEVEVDYDDDDDDDGDNDYSGVVAVR